MAVHKFPGWIDVHVHLRDPGATQKENFDTGTRAAIAGGFTTILDMPNNPKPTITRVALDEKISLSDKKSHCFVGFHFGTDGHNLDQFPLVWNNECVFGLKIYGNHTTGTLLVQDEKTLDRIFDAWKSEKPILVHAEEGVLELMVFLSQKYHRLLHVCHIAKKGDVEQVRRVKKTSNIVTAGVTPHHLFLNRDDLKKLGPFGLMKPELGGRADQESLWDGLASGVIDCIETDHAPHTREEKNSSKPPYGVPGLETAWGLMLTAVKSGRLSLSRLLDLMHRNPAKIFNIHIAPNTYIESDPDKPYIVENSGLLTKCGWSPFAGWELYGRVEKAVINSRTLIRGGKFLEII